LVSNYFNYGDSLEKGKNDSIQTPAGNLKFGPNALEPTQKIKIY
jgi:hypothetical protein